ncbi:Undecaprenyl-phosphate alpha-N-acetylglucosaminyl 1-phosphate transferase [hydrothermal vent metagenome]|uniref:Undecaprenyl-phosphate alpha-N-acetylglucosaminyl 1-phosphate transferase n=1 Tax=hydrothermal vent metagenome TaxID=652676 RepID=A0A3B1E7C5_9ZZZZ
MIWLSLTLILLALAISLPLTGLLVRLGHRLKTYDSAGSAGHAKPDLRLIPNTGGIAIFAGLALPLATGLLLVKLGLTDALTARVPALAEHLPGIAQQTPAALTLLACLTILHLLGLIDDRRALGPWVKLVVMLGCATAMTLVTHSRLFTFLDPHVGGPWLSIACTILWITLVTNALNFIDNMDGLCAGVTTIAATCFLAAALLHGQWFIAAALALLVGATLGFLAFNRPPARIFMGDGGSLVIGFTLAFLTVRTTYYDPGAAGGWYGVFMPLAVLAVPLYDFTSVTIVRLRQGKNPFQGDQQHLSHRLVKRGLTKPAAVGLLWSLTAITGISGIILGSLEPWQAILVGLQIIIALLALAFAEHATSPGADQDHEKT